jgi:FkbM family methyltransferase
MMNHLKALIRKRLANRGWELTKLTAHNGIGLDLAPLAIEHCILSGGNATLLQIGANDGVRVDPVQELVKKYKLSALLVEPMPHLFAALKQNYTGYPNVRFENVGVSSKGGKATIYQIDPTAKEYPDWIHGTATLDRDVIMKHQEASGVSRSHYERHIQEIAIPVLTVTELLARHPDLAGVSIVVIDTEGHDFHVVKSVLNSGILPALITYEHKHLSVQDQIECRASLSRLNYHLVSGGDDTIAYLRSSAGG